MGGIVKNFNISLVIILGFMLVLLLMGYSVDQVIALIRELPTILGAFIPIK